MLLDSLLSPTATSHTTLQLPKFIGLLAHLVIRGLGFSLGAVDKKHRGDLETIFPPVHYSGTSDKHMVQPKPFSSAGSISTLFICVNKQQHVLFWDALL